MDDTIGSEAKPIQKQAYNLIEQGISWLNIKHDKKIIYKSDRLKTYYEYAEELIKKGYMYVCSCDRETIQNLRRKAIDCECRNNTDTENLEKYKQMFSKEAQPGELVVRLKTSMQHKNPAFRDRIMFRISNQEHPKTKNKYKVWPLLEFSWAIDDHLLGITHIIRGIDLLMESQVEEHIWDIFNWEKPQIIHTGHFSIEGLKISKSKGAQEVLSGEYIGWNDPRTWSLQALKDRGILPESIREFINSMGITKSNSKIAIDILYTINRKNLENKPRYFFIPNPVKIKINGAPELEPEIPLHPSQTLNLGTRTYKTFQEFFISKKDFDCMKHESENNENYRFMHLFNFQIKKDSLSNKLELRFLSEEHEKNLEAKFIQWISATNKDKDNNIKTTIRMPDNSIIEGLAEPEIINIKPSDIIQFERFGFVRLHKIDKKTKTAEFWFSHK